mgnify:CR=1 FL=1
MEKDIVKIICYRRESEMERQDAIREFTEGVMVCNGSERDRYMNILLDLMAGMKVCRDERR